MEKTLKEVASNPAAIFSHLAENSLRHNWRLMSQAQKERLLGRFHFWVQGDVLEEIDNPFSGRTRKIDVFVGNWSTHAAGGYFETLEEALDDGLEALLQEWDVSYVVEIWLSKDRCPLKECAEAAAIMRLERNRQ